MGFGNDNHWVTCDTCGQRLWAEEDFGDYTSYDSYYTVWSFYASDSDDALESLTVCPNCGAELSTYRTTDERD